MRRRAARAVACGAVVVGLLAAAADARLGAQTPARVEFDEAVARAVARNPGVAQAATAITRAGALLEQARTVLRPTVSAAVTNVTFDSERGFSGGVVQPQNQFTFSASAAVPIVAPLQRAGIDQARDQVDVATAQVAEVKYRIGVAAAQAYLGVIAARRQVDVRERALQTARAHLEFATRRLDAGAGSRLNQLRAAQAVTVDESELEASRLALRLAQEALGLVLAADGPIDAGREPAFDVPATIDEATWRAARPDVQVQAAMQRAAERILRDSAKDWWPSATASFDPSVTAPTGLFSPSRTWRFTVSVSQPVFDGGARRASRALRSLTLDQSRIARTDVELRARSEIRVAAESVASLERRLASARVSASQAAEVMRITSTAFELGATTNLEVIDAQRSARDAEAIVAFAEDAVRRARLDLVIALGRFR
jgi:multidrug efflux system outer membrane protein